MSTASASHRYPRRIFATLARACMILLLCTGVLVHAAPAAQAVPAFAGPVLQADAWVPNGRVYAVAQSGNTIYIGGDFSYVGPPTGRFAALDRDIGAIDTGFPKVDGPIWAIAPDDAGGWYIGGSFTTVGGVAQRNNLAHIRADKTLDPAWTPSANNTVTSLAISGATLYAGGAFTSIDGQPRSYLAGIDAASGAVTGWTPNADARVETLVASGTTLYAGGDFSSIGGQPRSYLAGIDAASGAVTGWTPNADARVETLVVSGTTVYAGGDFSSIGGQPRNRLAALDASTGDATAWNPNVSGTVWALAVNGTTVYAGGQFSSIGGQPRNNLAALDIATGDATPWNPDVFGSVLALSVSDGTLYAGGHFSSIGGQPRDNLAALDITSGGLTGWNPGAGGTVRALAVSETTVYAGGDFTSIGGVPRNNLAALDATTGIATNWNPNAGDLVEALAVSGGTVYAGGGDFSSIGGQERHYLAALDAVTGAATAWNPDPDDEVEALVVNGSTIYASGRFRRIDDQPIQFFAALDTTTGATTPWEPGVGVRRALAVNGQTLYASNPLVALDTISGAVSIWHPGVSSVQTAVVSGTTIYAGGTFSSAGSQPRNNLAALNAITGAATPWNPNANNRVNALAVSGTTIYVGGAFTSIGGQARNYLAALDATTGAATPWNPAVNNGLNNSVDALVVNDSTVYVGGQFASIGGQVHPYFAIFRDVQPTAITDPATGISATGATLNGTVNAHGASTTVSFEYTIASGDYSQAITVAASPSPVSGTSAVSTSATLAGLTPSTTYFYRVVATNGGSSATGDERSFTTGSGTTDDLTASSSDLWLDPVAIHQGDVSSGLGLNVRRRSGKQPLFNIVVQFYVGNPAAGGTPIGSGVVAALGPRSQASTSKVAWNPTAGTYTLYAVIDPANQVHEADESNNVVSRVVTVLPVNSAPPGEFSSFLPSMQR